MFKRLVGQANGPGAINQGQMGTVASVVGEVADHKAVTSLWMWASRGQI